MSKTAVDLISLFSGLCGITAFILYFLTLTKSQRTVSLLLSSILVGIPLVLLVIEESIWLLAITVMIYTSSIVTFSFFYGKARAELKMGLSDIILTTNKRANGKEWIIENILHAKAGAIQIDCYGVKLDALYKVIKGSTYKSKLPADVEIHMRALLLKTNSFGVFSRAKIENNDRVIKDVELMNEVWCQLVRQYESHESHALRVRVFESTPAFYILRVNDNMLVGTYLAESGYENLCLHLTKADGKTFYQFQRFFDRIWEECSEDIG